MINLRLLTSIREQQTIVKPTFAGFAPHMLRHSFATQQLKQGDYSNTMPVLIGHNSSKTKETCTLVSAQEIGKIKNPLNDFTQPKGQQYADSGTTVEQKQKYNGNKFSLSWIYTL